ncbi:RsmB/NOP family class I SAM-dependent RNA methyltransferase [Thiohalocapsa marina]|uniref:RsmB/NOP family class I SAM-dependent RNA methyltransferase n=2 Tax=Thiohalocapsa marina TaxID=424902 RepID=A0A5M8FQF3_9GAMM|nr:RsmB/NOP family class I SAM-dependent RNA methyltransferase [Thiohalocapsa marina]
MRLDADALVALLDAEGVPTGPVPWLRHPTLGRALQLPPGFKAGQRWWYCAGLAHAQEAVSQLPVTLLGLAPGASDPVTRVLDLCAAPGGKTAQIALALGNRGTVLANDFTPERIAALQGNLDRLGLVNVSTTWCDGSNYPAAAGPFDRILVDAPCSSEGTLRRNRRLVGTLRTGDGPARSARMAARQRALLRKAVQLCRPGGRIVYSTCTFAPEENELIVAEALDAAAGRLTLLPVDVPGLRVGAGVTRWQGRTLDPRLALCARLWPHWNDTGGFFVAVLEKTAETGAGSGPPAHAARRLDLAPEDAPWLDGLVERYGLPDGLRERYRFHRQTRRGLHLAAADHTPPVSPPAQGSGLFFHRTNMRPPKLTTAGALLLGPQATRNRMDLTLPQRDAYLRREAFTPGPEQTRDCRPGQVLVRYCGHTLGVAVLHRSGTLESLFPRKWSGCTAGG